MRIFQVIPKAATLLPRSSSRNSKSYSVPPPRGNRASTWSHPPYFISNVNCNRAKRTLTLVAMGKLNMGMLQTDYDKDHVSIGASMTHIEGRTVFF